MFFVFFVFSACCTGKADTSLQKGPRAGARAGEGGRQRRAGGKGLPAPSRCLLPTGSVTNACLLDVARHHTAASESFVNVIERQKCKKNPSGSQISPQVMILFPLLKWVFIHLIISMAACRACIISITTFIYFLNYFFITIEVFIYSISYSMQ